MEPEPLAVQEAPPAATQDQVGERSEAGTGSETVTPLTGLGPELEATIV